MTISLIMYFESLIKNITSDTTFLTLVSVEHFTNVLLHDKLISYVFQELNKKHY